LIEDRDKLDKDKASQGGVEQEEIGRDENWFSQVASDFAAWFANVKRTYDEYQQVSLEGIKNQQKYQEKVLSDAQQNDNTRQNIANQSLQNAVETANMIGKQAVRHSDLAIDRQWNVDEVAQIIGHQPFFTEAVEAAVTKALAKNKAV
jgi:hypothetical protein